MDDHRHTQHDRPVLVPDTNVWLDLLCFRDRTVEPLRLLAVSGALRLVINSRTRDEWRRVLGYPQLALDADRQQRLLDEYAGMATSFEATSLPAGAFDGSVLPRCKDPDDQMFLELARACGAEALLTRDNALLMLDRRCRRVAGFAVLPPTTWLRGKLERPDSGSRAIDAGI